MNNLTLTSNMLLLDNIYVISDKKRKILQK